MTTNKCNKNTLEQDIENCVKSYLNTSKTPFIINKYSIQTMGSELKGFLGEYQKIKVNFELSGKISNLYLFIKSIPKNEEQAEQIEKYGFFHRETNIFAKIFPLFTKRDDEDRFLPKCLLIKKNHLFFEDLNIKGFKNTNNRESFDDNHCYAALTQIAKFHAESIILEESKSNGYKIIDEFKFCLNQIGYIYEGWYSAGVEAGLEVAKSSSKFPKNIDLILFENNWRKLFKNTLKLCDQSKTTRNVLCHRDLWSNNLMFRYDEQGKPIQSIIIDFQSCGYMPPAGDVMAFIYLNVIDHRRHNNLENYLQYYYQTLSNEVSKVNINLNDLITWKEFRKSCEEYKKLALIQCIILQQLCLVEAKQAKDIFGNSETHNHVMEVSRNDIILNLVKTDPVFKEKFLFSIDETIELCL